jgi:WD40 repeat protein
MNESGTRCATAGADFHIKVWNAIKGKQMAEFEDSSVVKSVDFSIDEKSIISGGYSKRILVFSITGGSKSPTLAIEHPAVSRPLRCPLQRHCCCSCKHRPCDSNQRIAAREQTL